MMRKGKMLPTVYQQCIRVPAQLENVTPKTSELKNLNRIRSIRSHNRHPSLDSVEIVLMTDVDNPFHGPQGAAHIYGPQKGATPAKIVSLDRGLKNFAASIRSFNATRINEVVGAGAGGGIAGGAYALLDAKICSGAEVIMQLMGLEQAIAQCDWVVTGEGKVDGQTLSGKVVKRIIDTANSLNKPSVVLCGLAELNDSEVKELGCDYIDSILENCGDTQTAMANSYDLLVEIAGKMTRKFG